MKKLFFALLCVLLTAGFAFAVDVDLKGMYEARGSYINNSGGLGTDDDDGSWDYFYFDHELDLTARLLVTDKTRVIVNFEIRDENWLAGNTDGSAENRDTDMDDNIEFKRVFSSHTFDAYGTVLDLGLMTGGAWMTGFADNANGRYRVKVSQPTEFGPIIGIYEKNAELGATSGVKDGEKDDYNAYYLAMVTKLGSFNLYPLLGYLDNSAAVLDQGSDGNEGLLFDFGVSATFGDIGFEAEAQIQDWDSDVTDDYTLWGAYGNVWWNIGAGKIGLLGAYGNWDEDSGQGFGFGEDFTPTMFITDWTGFGGTVDPTTVRAEYKSVALIQLYGSLALSEELSIYANGAYFASTTDDNPDGTDNFWKDADGYEIDAGLDWKLTDQVTYSILAAFGELTLDGDGKDANGGDPDSFARVYHKFRIDF
ncbi:MAG: hypothetical protein V2I56_19490 [Desulfobacteraceae bacterium]|jgi:hypothetical protein|nr:hypothetical protein [Desulfobacteraceae bacterium]